ncbi:shikimate dehydrogenase family protein [Pedobacter gandavensis]|uniref:Shikimate dehydrogenase n=1 Tax=Pedobacter gandavensis TaxID=2679963 RepID=A0ABR6EYG1_9SPHI|nr:shikimate dehydrogenase [Pedobacter gandavensis]MBB2150320.1 shikimate dehydrogenase [Pedobacter gandavensis]
MKKFGLIGYPLSHSFSKKHFSEKFAKEQISDCEYELYPIENISSFPELIIADEEIRGINVTIPHKLGVMAYLNHLDEAAAEIGAVNCVDIRRENGKTVLKGYNTDAYGFEASLRPFLKAHHTKALVFGDGGAAKAVKYVLNKLGISFLVVTRKPAAGTILYEAVDAKMMEEYTLLINTTPLGMSPNVESCPEIPYESITEKHLAYDLVYNPEVTKFLERSAASGAATKNGLEMLYLQAERSWHIWNS